MCQNKLIVALNDISSKDALQTDIYSIAASCGLAGHEFNDVVDTIVVGNELVYNGATAAEVEDFMF